MIQPHLDAAFFSSTLKDKTLLSNLRFVCMRSVLLSCKLFIRSLSAVMVMYCSMMKTSRRTQMIPRPTEINTKHLLPPEEQNTKHTNISEYSSCY